VAKLDEGHRLAALWQALPEELRLSPHRYLATNSPQGPWWLLGWCERVPEADEVLPAPLPPYRVLTGLVDRFGRTQTFHREAAGEFSGEITGVTDADLSGVLPAAPARVRPAGDLHPVSPRRRAPATVTRCGCNRPHRETGAQNT
ncbi:hypothetical protein, partial [Escherichia coli]|uniref:hypothetical protein n=1 Tax=Escherichia coli TaxID=562 RepID=UPI00208DDB52